MTSKYANTFTSANAHPPLDSRFNHTLILQPLSLPRYRAPVWQTKALFSVGCMVAQLTERDEKERTGWSPGIRFVHVPTQYGRRDLSVTPLLALKKRGSIFTENTERTNNDDGISQTTEAPRSCLFPMCGIRRAASIQESSANQRPLQLRTSTW